MEQLSKRYFPALLVKDLPKEVIKVAYTKMPAPKRAELVLSCDDQVRDIFYGIVGEPGKKMRDILDLEMSDLQKDEDTVSRIRDDKDKIWQGFVKIVRSLIKTDAAVAKSTSKALSAWIETQRNGDASTHEKSAA